MQLQGGAECICSRLSQHSDKSEKLVKEQAVKRPLRRSVVLQQIETRPDVFQFRHIDVDERHVAGLVKVLQNKQELEPLTLWEDPSGGSLVLIDGHHRLAAYEEFERKKKVPATIYNCDLDRARLLALEENTKTRLPLTQAERTDAAWRLVCLDGIYSKRQTVKATGVADGTIGKMRRTYKKLSEATDDSVLPDSWADALRELRATDRREFTPEEWDAFTAAAAGALDDKIGKPLGDAAQRNREAACSVVVDRLGKQAMEYLFDHYGPQFGYYLAGEIDEDSAPF